MIHLHVTVRLHGAIVEDRVCTVRDAVRLGEADDAEVAFPGADLLVRRVEDRLLVRGRWLDLGDATSVDLGAVRVELEAAIPARFPRAPFSRPDLRLVVATIAIALTGSFWDALSRFVERHPDATRSVAELVAPRAAPIGIDAPRGGDDARNAGIRSLEQGLPEPDASFELQFPLPGAEPGAGAADPHESLDTWPPAVYRVGPLLQGDREQAEEPWPEPQSTPDPSTR